MCNHIIKNIRPFVLVASALLLTACNGFFEKDNTPPPAPLTKIATEVQPRLLWSTRTGGGTDGEYLKMAPALGANAIYTAGAKGNVTAVDKTTGRILWEVGTRLPVTAGPGVGNGIVVVVSRRGDVMALDQANGKSLWKVSVPGEILAKPAVENNVVIIKTIDGNVRALSAQNGQERWNYQQAEPTLILRGASAPVARGRDVLVGFANGNLAKFGLSDGRLFWIQPIAIAEGAFAIQRMIDIDANPIVYSNHIYAATYQGKIASLDWTSGRILWTHDISSYTGMIADNNNVYISDAKSHVWGFDANSGLVNWRQDKLEARGVSGPAVMGHYVVVGDAEGYLHWLGKTDGHFAGRVSAGSAIYTSPIVDEGTVYAFTNKGNLLAYTLGR